jgi:hypothetical protein
VSSIRGIGEQNVADDAVFVHDTAGDELFKSNSMFVAKVAFCDGLFDRIKHKQRRI